MQGTGEGVACTIMFSCYDYRGLMMRQSSQALRDGSQGCVGGLPRSDFINDSKGSAAARVVGSLLVGWVGQALAICSANQAAGARLIMPFTPCQAVAH